MNSDPNLWNRYSLKDKLPKLKIPSIFIWGKQDAVASVEIGYKLEKMLPEVEFYFLDNCGHQCQTDQPDVVNQMVIDFFSSETRETVTNQ